MLSTQIGVISDTHGLLRPEAVDALKGSELIIHAGDVGAPEILEALGRIAPVVAVRGNVDTAPWARILPTDGGRRGGRQSCSTCFTRSTTSISIRARQALRP